jgi:hypothetical protein
LTKINRRKKKKKTFPKTNQENRKEKKKLHQCQRGKNLERVAVTIANHCLFFAPAAAAKKNYVS